MKASCFIFSYLKLYTTMPIAKLAAFLDMVRKPEVSFQLQINEETLSLRFSKQVKTGRLLRTFRPDLSNWDMLLALLKLRWSLSSAELTTYVKKWTQSQK